MYGQPKSTERGRVDRDMGREDSMHNFSNLHAKDLELLGGYSVSLFDKE